MAAKKRGRKKKVVVPDVVKPGRKKELKRFEMLTLTRADTTEFDENEVAFVIRTSGGTPLNQTDVGKAFRTLQHLLRSLGHKLKRKGQELDPAPKPEEPKQEEAPPTQNSEQNPTVEPASEPEATEEAPADPEPVPNPSLSDPDDSDPNN